MKKVGLFTIIDYNNYGNRLQNYAVQEYLKSLSFEVETVKNFTRYSKYFSEPTIFSRFKNLTRMNPIDVIFKIKNMAISLANRKSIEELKDLRRELFKKFTQNYISESKFDFNDSLVPSDLGERYDYYVVGSDQVWNPYNPRTSEIDFLTFAPMKKRVALSASFGVNCVPPDQVERYKMWLSGMQFVSVRELAGATIINSLTGKNATILVDPTMLLSKEKWLKIARPAVNKPKSNYILTYFLGSIPKEVLRKIAILKLESDFETINLGDLKNKDSFVTGPCEFIDYIVDCEIFITDSFHGAVFSILFEKPFIICKREGVESMYSRIDTLLEKFKLESRKMENVILIKDSLNIDYSHVSKVLEIERYKVFTFLQKALNIEMSYAELNQ